MAVASNTSCVKSVPVPLVDACDTEWRSAVARGAQQSARVPLVDACDTEWRTEEDIESPGTRARATR